MIGCIEDLAYHRAPLDDGNRSITDVAYGAGELFLGVILHWKGVGSAH